MPELTLTEAQLERLEAVREDLEAAYVGPYGHVRDRDVIEYLLDTYTPPEELEEGTTEADGRSGGPVDAAERVRAEASANSPAASGGAVDTDSGPDGSDDESGSGVDESRGDDEAGTRDGESSSSDSERSDEEGDGAADPESTLQQAMSLLDAHDDKWREGSGDEPYEVDLPDGSVEPARTKDDVRRLLFKHHR